MSRPKKHKPQPPPSWQSGIDFDKAYLRFRQGRYDAVTRFLEHVHREQHTAHFTMTSDGLVYHPDTTDEEPLAQDE